MKHVHTLSVGIAPYETLKERTLAIARGEYKPGRQEPKIWFSSMESLAHVLSTQNKVLLEIIATARPSSLTKLAEISGRHKSNLSRTLKTMERYGLINLRRQKSGEIIPQVTFDRLRVHLELDKDFAVNHFSLTPFIDGFIGTQKYTNSKAANYEILFSRSPY